MDRTERLRKLLLVAAALVACLLAGCGGPYAKLTNYSLGTGAGGCEAIGRPYWWAIWSVEASHPTTITGIQLDPPTHPGVRVVKEDVETKNAGGGGNIIYTPANMNFHLPKGYDFARWTALEPATKAPISAHRKTTFELVLEPERAGTWHWKGLRVFWDHTSKVIPTIFTIKAGRHPDQMKDC